MDKYKVDLYITYRTTLTVESDTVEGAAEQALEAAIRSAKDNDVNLGKVEVTEVRKNGVPA